MLVKTKTIVLKGVFYLIALQILNLSIDVDYVTHDFHCSLPSVDYDDIDSFTELGGKRLIQVKTRGLY